MGTHTGSVMTLANSIIGVSVLAMPFCFKQCGIVLSILMLMLSSIISRLACHYLIKSAVMEKRRNFEMLAFRAFGPTGKLTVELCIIGFLLGTCIAFFVVVGDLGPAILAPMLGFQHPMALRPSVLIGLGVFVVLPLGLLRNVESLTTLSAASIAFYLCLVFKVIGEATTNFINWDWLDKVYYWRPSGVMQCLPIFSMALSCQTQLFEIFDSLPSTPIDRMNAVVRSAINITTLFYIAVGFFGYVAFCNQPFSGNLMLSFSPTLTSEVIKLGFVLSVAVSFPLAIFPCRASIYSLLFSKGLTVGYESSLGGSSHIPENKFQCITLAIVTTSLVVGLISRNIEFVLGLVGSTIGVFICLIIPALIFVSLSNRNTNERLLAKVLVATGLLVMVMGTYTNLTVEESGEPSESHISLESINKQSHPLSSVKGSKSVDELIPRVQPIKIDQTNEKVIIQDETLKDLKNVKELAALPELQQKKDSPKIVIPVLGKIETLHEEDKKKLDNKVQLKTLDDTKNKKGKDFESEDIRREPPNPQAPISVPIVEASKEKEDPLESKKFSKKPNINLEEMNKQEKVKEDKKEKKVRILPEKKKLDPKKADELIEKLIKHEEAHKKLISEGKQLINELKKSETKELTGVVHKDSDVYINKSDIVRLNEIKKVENEKEIVIDSMTKKMVQGVPLPVAVKEQLENKKIKNIKRGEEREKRDLTEVVSRDVGEETLKQTELPTTKEEECKKENSKEAVKIETVPGKEGHLLEDIIRTPAFLSNPKEEIGNEENHKDLSQKTKDIKTVIGASLVLSSHKKK